MGIFGTQEVWETETELKAPGTPKKIIQQSLVREEATTESSGVEQRIQGRSHQPGRYSAPGITKQECLLGVISRVAVFLGCWSIRTNPHTGPVIVSLIRLLWVSRFPVPAWDRLPAPPGLKEHKCLLPDIQARVLATTQHHSSTSQAALPVPFPPLYPALPFSHPPTCRLPAHSASWRSQGSRKGLGQGAPRTTGPG